MKYLEITTYYDKENDWLGYAEAVVKSHGGKRCDGKYQTCSFFDDCLIWMAEFPDEEKRTACKLELNTWKNIEARNTGYAVPQ